MPFVPLFSLIQLPLLYWCLCGDWGQLHTDGTRQNSIYFYFMNIAIYMADNIGNFSNSQWIFVFILKSGKYTHTHANNDRIEFTTVDHPCRRHRRRRRLASRTM